MIRAALLIALAHNTFFYLVLFSPILGHNVAQMFLYWSHVDTWWWVLVQYTSIIITWGFLIHIIFRLFISLLTVLIWWRGRTVRVLKVSQAASLMSNFPCGLTLPFSLCITNVSVVLICSIYIGSVLTSAIRRVPAQDVTMWSHFSELQSCTIMFLSQFFILFSYLNSSRQNLGI